MKINQISLQLKNNYLDKTICRPMSFQNITSHGETTKSSRIELKQTASLPTDEIQEKLIKSVTSNFIFSGTLNPKQIVVVFLFSFILRIHPLKSLYVRHSKFLKRDVRRWSKVT